MGFDRLNQDCISSILEYVDDVSPKTTKNSIRFVNKTFYATTNIVGHRRKVLRFPGCGQTWHPDPDPADLDISSWLTNEDVLRGLHYLTIATDPLSPRLNTFQGDLRQQEKGKFENLATLIRKLGNLKLLNWSYHGPIPLDIIEALQENHPKAELQVYHFGRYDVSANHEDPAELALSKSANLTTLKVSLWNLNTKYHPDLQEAAIKRIVACAPNLRFASVVTRRGGWLTDTLTQEQLEEIEECSAKFFTHKKPNSALRALTLDGYPLSQATLKNWESFVDLSGLKSLKCSRGLPDASYFTYAPLVLTNLKHVSLNLGYGSQAIKSLKQTYIRDIPPLESLSLWSWIDAVSLDNILERHGKTLRTLQLHQRETTAVHDGEKRRLLSLDDLKSIKAQCPRLRDLTFDIDRYSRDLEPEVELKQHADKLETIASMNLEKLQIYFDLGIATMSDSYDASYESADEEEHTDDYDDRAPEAQGPAVSSSAQMVPDQSPLHPSPTQSPPAKRLKKVRHAGVFSPSPDEAIEPFVKELWKKVFGVRPNGKRRALDVKFGEWERTIAGGYAVPWQIKEQSQKSWWLVRPDERDDRPGECVVTRYGKMS